MRLMLIAVVVTGCGPMVEPPSAGAPCDRATEADYCVGDGRLLACLAGVWEPVACNACVKDQPIACNSANGTCPCD